LQDVHSVSTDPIFTSATNFIPASGGVNNVGVYLSAVPTDFVGAPRMDPPDAGAYEFSVDPDITTNAASAITGTGATLNGFINANNNPAITAGFEYGPTTAYGSSAGASPAIVSGFPGVGVNAVLTNLLPNTTYHYLVRGVNTTTFYGHDITFDLPAILPEATSTEATAIGSSVATLNGTIKANNATTVVTFEYGITTAYGSTATAIESPVNGMAVTPVSFSLSGLLPNTLYHYRVTGTNVAGTANGGDLTFTTMLPENISVTGTVTNLLDTCYNASNTIIVAGGDDIFEVSNGGRATFIAGVNILFMPGTTVQPGGYMLGTISTGTYCGSATMPMVAVVTGQKESLSGSGDAVFSVYPNPTTGNFFILQKDGHSCDNIRIEAYNMQGVKVMTASMTSEKKHEFNFSAMPTGLFFVKVIADGYMETVKLVKL